MADSSDSKGFDFLRIDVKEDYDLADDIDCKTWLSEINLSQYLETFLVNLSIDGRVIRRKRLSQLRQQDLSSMNITNYSHQKRLMEHIRLVLKFAFHSPNRKKELKMECYSPLEREFSALSLESGLALPSSYAPTKKESKPKIDPTKKKKMQARRRRSFDADVWNSITNMRKKSGNSAYVVNQLREGAFSNPEPAFKPDNSNNSADSVNRAKTAFSYLGSNGDSATKLPEASDGTVSTRSHRRRHSFGGSDGDSQVSASSIERAKAMMYGNMALEYDIMLSNLHHLQKEVLNRFKETIGCEVVSIFFVNNATRELLLFSADAKWYRIPFGTGICGFCHATGENVNIPDAYSDYRFNKNMDVKTGFRTRNILCQPIRGMRGAGPIVGVIQMINKIGADAFDSNDEEMLLTFVAGVADLLSAKFNNLINIAEKFAGQAIFVGSKQPTESDNHMAHTKSSQSRVNTAGGGSSNGSTEHK